MRRYYDGPSRLSAIAHGASILAARRRWRGLRLAGHRFIATEEARAVEGYKQMIVDSTAQDIVYSSTFTGIHGNYLKRRSVRKEPGSTSDNLPAPTRPR